MGFYPISGIYVFNLTIINSLSLYYYKFLTEPHSAIVISPVTGYNLSHLPYLIIYIDPPR